MKIVIELNDADLKKAIDQQVSAAIASMTTNAIREKIDAILEIKFGRINETVVMAGVNEAARKKVDAVANSYNNSVVREALARAAERLIKEKM